MKTLSFVLLLLLAACARPKSSSPSAPRADQPTTSSDAQDAAFAQLADEYIAGYLAWRPLVGTTLGLHQYDGKITDFSQASLKTELGRLKSYERRLAEVKTAQLSFTPYYDYRILLGAIEREIFGFEQMQVYSRNPMTYADALDVSIYVKRNFAPLDDRVRSIIAILDRAPNIFAAARRNLAEVLPRPEVETAIEEANGTADFLGKDLVETLHEVKDQKLMADFQAANSRAIQELRAYVAYLKEKKLPQADNSFALGREKYVKMLQSGEMLDLAPEKVLELGMAELRRNQRVFAEAAREIDPNQKPSAMYQAIQKEHPAADALIPDTAKGLEQIRQFVVDRRIINIPSPVRAQVMETPQFLRATSFASMDTPGPFEAKAAEAYYYVTPVEPDWTPKQKEEWLSAFNYYDIAVTSIHEAYPGHYVQFLCLNASPATRLEKILTSYAFTEGWAHYCEQMMLDEGFGASPSKSPTREEQVTAAKYRVAQADEALLRVCRLCVSIKMHCQGMSVDEATRFFEDNCYYEEKPARDEAIRGTFDPEYLYYTVGKLEILKLRADYQRQEGARFSLRRFHNEMLRHGAPPLRLLREAMLKDKSTWDQVL
ncbi:MAG TPA: DUF885 domain-containing protein [Verrucomicrobiae bacterium]|nr:DUF885 domain-containing protein [Verrucomicrobiae bacterium]